MYQASIGHNFITFGNEGVGVHHTVERRMSEVKKHQIVANLRNEYQPSWLRRSLGSLLITTGALIAGKSAHIQDRQATMPAPAPKSGMLPTR
jgi:hypothetical protein